MQLGAAVWVTDFGVGISDLAQTAKQAGLESLFLTDHTHVPVGRGDVVDDDLHRQDPHILDQFATLGAAAMVTSRLRLGTGACIVAQRDPIILAKQVATIDHLSGGRFAIRRRRRVAGRRDAEPWCPFITGGLLVR